MQAEILGCLHKSLGAPKHNKIHFTESPIYDIFLYEKAKRGLLFKVEVLEQFGWKGIDVVADLTEKTLATDRKYTGKIISVDLLDIELPDGRKAKREVIRHGNAVAILARRPDGKFVFVKQYRKAAEEALVEVIAGGLEPGEDPIEGARRETAEETGYEVTSIKFLTTIICTPGYCEERIHLYFAELSETAHAQDQDPDENVYPVVLSETEVEDGIRNGTIFDSKTLSAWLCWKITR